MAPGIEVKPPRISTGSALSAMICSAKDTSERAPHMMPVASATMPAANQTMTQIWLSEMPTESAALWLSATARRARPIRVLEKNTASAGDHQGGDHGGGDVDMLEAHQPAQHRQLASCPAAGRARSAIICFGLPPKISSPKPMRK